MASFACQSDFYKYQMWKKTRREMTKFILRCIHYAIVALLLYTVNTLFPDAIFYYFSCIANFILYALVATVTYRSLKHLYDDERVSVIQKAVLITGCDRGFGNQLAKKLDSVGFHVFASCLFPEGEGARQLKQSCSDRLQVLYLDVTKDETVEKAFQFVKNNLGSNDLWAVVNNAGHCKGFSVELSSMEDFKDTIDVNVLGQVRVAKAFLPLLKKCKGRIVNITSLAARLSCMDMCAYNVSKCAALGFTECLSLEMNPWGIHCISIEPEFFRTALTDPELIIRRLEVDVNRLSRDVLLSYGDEYFEKLKKYIVKMLDLSCFDTSIVVDTVETAVTQKHPSPVYKPRRNAVVRIVFNTLECLPFEMYKPIVLLFTWITGYPSPKAKAA